MKNKVLAAILFITLLFPAVTMAEEPVADIVAQQEQEETVVADSITPANLDEDVVEQPQEEVAPTPFKKPISKKKILKKFLLAMFGVGVSSFLIFFVLSLYNRIRGKVTGVVKTPDGETSLETPEDIDSAVKTFLEKTDWTK